MIAAVLLAKLCLAVYWCTNKSYCFPTAVPPLNSKPVTHSLPMQPSRPTATATVKPQIKTTSKLLCNTIIKGHSPINEFE